MRKVFALLLTLAMVLSLAACGGQSAAQSSGDNSTGNHSYSASGSVYII